MNKFFAIAITSLLFLSACGTTPKTVKTTPPPNNTHSLKELNHFEISGKLGYRNGQKGGNASLFYHQENGSYSIRLYGPLGSGTLQIAGRQGSVQMIAPNGRTQSARTPEELVRRTLGWEIPVSGLQYWIKATPAPGRAPSHVVYNNQKELTQFVQDGWQIHYTEYRKIGNLNVPYSMSLMNGPIRVRLILQNWSFSR